MKSAWLVIVLCLTACVDATQTTSNHSQTSPITGYDSLAIGKVQFTKIKGAKSLESAFREKLKTSMFEQGIGHRYVSEANARSLIIIVEINSLAYGDANLRMLLPGLSEGTVGGIITIQDLAGNVFSTLDSNATTVGGTWFSGLANSDALMDMLANNAVRESKRLLEGDSYENTTGTSRNAYPGSLRAR